MNDTSIFHVFKLHLGWIRYINPDCVQSLLGINYDKFTQKRKQTILLEEDEVSKPYRMKLNTTGLMMRMLKCSYELKGTLTHEDEMEGSITSKLNDKKALFQWMLQEMEKMIKKMKGYPDSIWSNTQKEREVRAYDNLDWLLRVCLFSLSDDDLYETLYLKEAEKKEKRRKERLNRSENNRGNTSLTQTLEQDISSPGVRKIIEKANWRALKILDDIGIVSMNLIMGCRYWKRILGDNLEQNTPILSLVQIKSLFLILNALREGVYFPTLFDPYADSSDGRLQGNSEMFIVLRNLLLDQYCFHLYNETLIKGGTNRNDKASLSSGGGGISGLERKQLHSSWRWYIDIHTGSNLNELEDDIDDGYDENEEEEHTQQSHITLKEVGDEENQTERDDEEYGIGPWEEGMNESKIVFNIPKASKNRSMDKWIESHENVMIKYNIKKTRELMKVMQREHEMEMQFRKSKTLFKIDEKEKSNVNYVAPVKNTDLLPFNIDHYKVSSSLIPPTKKNQQSIMKARVPLHPSMESIKNSFPVPPIFKNILGDGMEATMKKRRIEDDDGDGVVYNSELVKSMEKVLYNREDKRVDVGIPVAEIEKGMEKLDIEKKASTIIRDISFLSLHSMNWSITLHTYSEKYPFGVDIWKGLEHIITRIFIDYTASSNEKEMVQDAHTWMVEYLFTPLWKRESYKMSGTGKINNKTKDAWKYAELEFYSDIYTEEDLLLPLKDLIQTLNPGSPILDMMESRGLHPITNYKHCGIFLPGYYHTLFRSLDDPDTANIVIGDIVNPMVDHPYQRDVNAYIVYWWLKQQLLQMDVDIDRSIFLWEAESKQHSLYRGMRMNSVLSRVGSDWVVLLTGEWNINGRLNAINCGRSIYIALYVWLEEMDKEEWNVEERAPSIKVWNEMVDIRKHGTAHMHRRGRKINLRGTLIYKLHESLKHSLLNNKV